MGLKGVEKVSVSSKKLLHSGSEKLERYVDQMQMFSELNIKACLCIN